ncbi:LacI family DNA-binding transcriptional regulator [Nonomuraea typhae]|uniref:LacI family DNA-binding transcriptional regulator n=1 Tax=Nonomuraea typhae TaxID=2603600 RepID=UPI0012F99211|nr:LacI family DNA-binding transcriptional regulator [Nonomuraea typhae]
MKDVAQAAGVALKTVSRVVNGESTVAPETLDRVQKVIRELGYRRNEGARQLRQGRSQVIAMVVRDIADPFFAAIGRAVETRAEESDLVVMIGSSHDEPAREREVALGFCARRPNALIVAPIAKRQDYLQPEVANGLPVCAVDRPAQGIACDAVLSDNIGGIRAAVDHLAAHGHRRIGYLGDDPAVFTSRERVAGFRAAMAARGLQVNEDEVRLGAPTPGSVGAALRTLLDPSDPVTALITANNRLTVEALKQLDTTPERPALVAFDDLELGELLNPGLTVVAQDPEAIGNAVMDLLTDQDREPREVRIPVTLIPRGSGELPPPP